MDVWGPDPQQRRDDTPPWWMAVVCGVAFSIMAAGVGFCATLGVGAALRVIAWWWP